MKKKYPKVLIVSHNPLSDTQSNGKTIASLFSNFPKESLAQLYFTMDTPDFTICDNFFRITDLDIMKNFLMINNNVGCKIDSLYAKKISSEKTNLHNNKFYNFIRKMFVSKISFMTTLRDFIWNNSYYYSNAFKKWIDDFNPDFVFFQSSNCCFAFEFVYEICKRRNIKLIMQTTDDYLSYRALGLFFNYNVYKLRKEYSKVNEYCISILPISDKMKRYYEKNYPNNYYVTMNNVEPDNSIEFKFNKEKIKMLYAGNLGLNRWKTLYLLASVINESGLNMEMEIYSIEPPSQKIIDKLNKFDCCKYGYSLNKEQLIAERKEADILLHVESFDYINKHLTRYSVSTKIPELMNSNRVILAIGPNDIASMEYLAESQSAFVVNKCDKTSLLRVITSISKNNNFKKYISNGHKSVKKNHDINKAQEYILKLLERSIIDDKN